MYILGSEIYICIHGPKILIYSSRRAQTLKWEGSMVIAGTAP
jgi:hypothetical protein